MLNVSIESFSYSDKEILKDISFQLKRGEHLAVLGESGCGKSTLLHIIYGLLHLEKGAISWNDTPLLGPKHHLIPGESFMKLVAQEFNIMPFSTVWENVGSHLTRQEEEKDHDRIRELLRVVDLEGFEKTLVKHLSGGQKQRVALAKALANAPQLLLLDEPFSNIDTFRKNALRRNLFEYLTLNNISCITATHDAEEALTYSNRILVLKDGTLDRIDSPETFFKTLETPYQAGFFNDFSELSEKVLFSGTASAATRIVLPHQLIYSQSVTPLRVMVKKSYFKGSYYRIRAVRGETIIWFDHFEAIEPETPLYLQYHE
ncbi:ATP-binding cassette domain-containing protein [Altibacter sp.]|uniref:ABC transporter ATP-binding protein n=1 Tax=Altibacter sp. TaxID=2024823 RepID=UPI000C98FBEB|nr:ATP-binding cassette domain-containing protein [Altibacter sp.]MAP55716.1 ABC transporter ATP-binding protein [Altibacter sp.]|tara:strand:- start:1630 stop:2580 length:951 start_codon:yes stop_codon:yes gene_type:complete